MSYILKNADIGIRVIDKNEIIIYCNNAIEKITGIKTEKVLGNHILEADEFLEESSSTLINCVRTGKSIYNKVKAQVNAKGEIEYLVVTNIPIIKDEEIIGAVEYVKSGDNFGDLLNYKEKNREKKTESFKACNINNSNGYIFDDFLTIEKDMIALIENIKNMSLYDYNVLIYGDTGTGKEVIAQSIHNRSYRNSKTFVAQNCAAIPGNLLESIFFGTEAGIYTGAIDKAGLFEQAHRGTLLLDELNSLPVFLQAKLLRVLQEGKIRRIGGKKDINVDVRIIATTSEKPQDLIKENRLREDLYYRLGPIYINIPPLRQRKLDIDYLTRVFIKRESKEIKVREPKISIKVKDFFREYPWYGNVRELKNVVKYILLNTSFTDVVELKHLPQYMQDSILEIEKANLDLDNFKYHQKIVEFEKTIIKNALDITKGNVSEASKLLGIKRQTLQYKIKTMRIK